MKLIFREGRTMVRKSFTRKKIIMHKTIKIAAVAVSLLMGGTLVRQSNAADANEDAIKQVMKDFHKAPKGVDPICKKASEGTASMDEIKKLIASYKVLAKTKAPQGEASSWTEKTKKLVETSMALEKGGAEAQAKYKEAVNCKACHSLHKPEDKK